MFESAETRNYNIWTHVCVYMCEQRADREVEDGSLKTRRAVLRCAEDGSKGKPCSALQGLCCSLLGRSCAPNCYTDCHSPSPQ